LGLTLEKLFFLALTLLLHWATRLLSLVLTLAQLDLTLEKLFFLALTLLLQLGLTLEKL
jgi:hypothetical protein